MLESLFNKIAYLKRLQHKCFLISFSTFLRTPFLQKSIGQLLLDVSHKTTLVIEARLWDGL